MYHALTDERRALAPAELVLLPSSSASLRLLEELLEPAAPSPACSPAER